MVFSREGLFKIVYLGMAVALMFAVLIPTVIILHAAFRLGRLPVYGDPTTIDFEGLDVIFGIAVLIMLIGPFIWAVMTAGVFAIKNDHFSRTGVILGLIAIALGILIFSSPRFVWLQD